MAQSEVPDKSAPQQDAPMDPADGAAGLGLCTVAKALPGPAMWACPVDGCGHKMKKDSGGRRAHMLRWHGILCLVPCQREPPCRHGCSECVPDKVLYQGLSASASSSGAKPPSKTASSSGAEPSKNAASSKASAATEPSKNAAPSKASPAKKACTSASSIGSKPSKTPCTSASSSQDKPSKTPCTSASGSTAKSSASSSGSKPSMTPRNSASSCQEKPSKMPRTSAPSSGSKPSMMPRKSLSSGSKPSVQRTIVQRIQASSSQDEPSKTPRTSATGSKTKPSSTPCKPSSDESRSAGNGHQNEKRGKKASSDDDDLPLAATVRSAAPASTEKGASLGAGQGRKRGHNALRSLKRAAFAKGINATDAGKTASTDDDDMPLAVTVASAAQASAAKAVSLRVKKGMNSSMKCKKGALVKFKDRMKRRRLGNLRCAHDRVKEVKASVADPARLQQRTEAMAAMRTFARTECLPQDVSLEHESRRKGRFDYGKQAYYFDNRRRGLSCLVALRKAGGDLEVCAHVGRLCYAKIMEGASREEVTAYRDQLYSLLEASRSKEVASGTEEKPVHGKRSLSSLQTSGEKKSKEQCLEVAQSSAADQEHAELKTESHKVEDDARDRMRKKVRTLARMARVLKTLRQENETEQGLEQEPSPVHNEEQAEELCVETQHCALEAAELLSLLRQGATVETVLRGVPPERQNELLALMDAGTSTSISTASELIEVPLGAETTMAEERTGTADAWTDVAYLRNIQWPTDCELPYLSRSGPPGGLGPEDDFSLGVIVGPSGSGVTRLLVRLTNDLGLPQAPSICFRSDQSVASQFEDAVSTLPMVGLNSVPAWMRPYHVLSNGQQQRVRLGLYLRSGAVIDDFGSGIGEQEVRSVANSIGKFIRKQRLSKVLIGTHSQDAVPFLQPDFVICVDGSWSVNPNPATQRCATVSLEPAFMGRCQQPGDDPPPDSSEAYQYTSQEAWPGAVKVMRRKLEVHVQPDQRTLDAANAFEHDFEGVAKCDIPVLPQSRLPETWFLGLVVGPSGTGKTTTIRNFCRAQDLLVDDGVEPTEGVTVFSHVATACNSADMAEEVLDACQLPRDCWLARFGSLSRSEQWRAHLAARLASSLAAENPSSQVVVVDEFTTQLDRCHARSLCKALALYVRVNGVRLLCATVHDDVVPWLCPCWVFDTARAEFACLQGAVSDLSDIADEPMDTLACCDPTDLAFWDPPVVCLDVQQVNLDSVQSLWQDQFKEHHYLTGSLNALSDGSFVVKERGTRAFAAFHASSMLPGKETSIREHRLVVRPEWQGFGVGPKLSNLLASRWSKAYADQNWRFSSKTAHPRLGELRQHDPCWCPTGSNLVKSTGESFGDLGKFAKEEKLPRIFLPHGTMLKLVKSVPKGSNFFRVAIRIPCQQVKMDVEIPMTEDINDEQVTGITFRGSKLLIDRFDPGGLANSTKMPDLAGGWELERINQQQVTSRAEVLEVLRKFAAVESLSLRKTHSDTMRGPDRASKTEAEEDLEWFRKRCVAQDSLQAEVKQVLQLFTALRKCARLTRGLPRHEPGALPPIPEVSLEVLPELSTAAEKARPSRKDRVCYSHFYVDEEGAGAWWDKPPPSVDSYQLWMLVRVPELRNEGLTHQAAIEAAMADWPACFVIRFEWSDVEESCGPHDEAVCSILGLVLGPECQVEEVLEESVNLSKVRGLMKSGRGARVTAIRRGKNKINVGSWDDLSAGMMTLGELEDADFWLYLIKTSKGSPITPGKGSQPVVHAAADEEQGECDGDPEIPDIE